MLSWNFIILILILIILAIIIFYNDVRPKNKYIFGQKDSYSFFFKKNKYDPYVYI